MNVLFVDADEVVAESVGSVLRRKGHSCEAVGNGEQAIALVQQHDYDIVVLEVSLPDMGGFDVIRRMKSERIEIPVLLQSGQSNKSRAVKTAKLEGEEVFAKPYIVTELIDRMEQIIALADERDRQFQVEPSDDDLRTRAEPESDPEPEPGFSELELRQLYGGSASERRMGVRNQFIEAALISDASGPIPCVVLNLSKSGAALKLPEPGRNCPSRFTLELLEGPAQRCEMRWRKGDRIGVTFI